MAYLKDRIYVKSTNLPVPDGTEVEIRLKSTNALLATVTTTDGFFSWQVDGYPGAIYYQCNQSGATKTHTSLSVGPAGPFQLGEMTDQMNFFIGGRVRGLDGEMLVTPKVSGLSVTVANGAFTSKGMIYRLYAAKDLTFVPGAPDNATTNAYGIYIVFSGKGSAEPGKTEMVVSNVAIGNEPALGTDMWRVELARVTIAPGQTSLTGGDISLTSGYSDRHTHTISDVTNFDPHVIELLRIALADYTTGVVARFRNGLAVTAAVGSQTSSTATGGVILNRADTTIMVDHNAAPVVIAIPATANSSLKRIDTIVLEVNGATGYRLDTVATIVRVAGTAAATAVAPTLQQDATKWQIPLADILSTNTGVVSMTDRRSVSSSGGGGTIVWSDKNFNATGWLSSGTRTLGSATYTFPAGTWFIDSQTHFQIVGTPNSGYVTIKLTGNAAPIAPDDSIRNFYHVGGVPATVILTGKKSITFATPTLVTLNATATFLSGAPCDTKDGVVFFTAQRVA